MRIFVTCNEFIQKIITYWTDCIRNEDVLGKDISLLVRTRAILYPFEQDIFIFNRKNTEEVIKDSKLRELVFKSQLHNEDIYYGYPILLYYDEEAKTNYISPLFIVKLNSTRNTNGEITISRDNNIPDCGIKALNKMGFRSEEIGLINQEIEKIFLSDLADSKTLLNRCMNVILEESTLSVNEEIDPKKIDINSKITSKMGIGLYNKNLIFIGDSNLYTVSLLKDLDGLKGKNDLFDTSLSNLMYLNKLEENSFNIINTPNLVLPYPLDEYQISALNEVFNNKLSVITGPPGTGKSQFIMNLIINLFLDNKKVLFVSNTNEAVNIVNEKINKDFQNLLFRTGKKELRQELSKNFNDMCIDYQKAYNEYPVSRREIDYIWKNIKINKLALMDIDKLEERINIIHEQNKLKKNFWLKIQEKFYLWRIRKRESKENLKKQIKQEREELFKLSKKYLKSIYIKQILGKKKASIGNAKCFLDEVKNLKFRDDLSDWAIRDALSVLSIWSSTLKSLNRNFPLSPNIFDYVIFDEASQIDLPSAAPALYRAKKAIIVGDPMQLIHIACITKEKDKEIAKTHNLDKYVDWYPSRIRYCDKSLYNCAELLLNKPPILLAKHYRSEDQIIDLCNNVFYSGKLIISSSLNYTDWPNSLKRGVHWIDCKGKSIKSFSGSRYNEEETIAIIKLLKHVLKEISDTTLSIGIVTPYSQQQKHITDILPKIFSENIIEKHNIKVLTAHKFQGSEKDIMIFSMVLSSVGNGNNDRWYNSNPQILNVSLSRAKYLLYIVGDFEFCHNKKEGILKKIADTYEKIKQRESLEEEYFSEKFDTSTEMFLYENLQKINFQEKGYKLKPQFVTKRYTLDFALIGKKKIDIECDGFKNHILIDNLPVIEDIERDSYLKKQGWEILRFQNHEIISNINRVLDIIKEKIQ